MKSIARQRGKSLQSIQADWLNNARGQIALNPPQKLQPDEYLIQDLQQTTQPLEYEVIIEG